MWTLRPDGACGSWCPRRACMGRVGGSQPDGRPGFRLLVSCLHRQPRACLPRARRGFRCALCRVVGAPQSPEGWCGHGPSSSRSLDASGPSHAGCHSWGLGLPGHRQPVIVSQTGWALDDDLQSGWRWSSAFWGEGAPRGRAGELTGRPLSQVRRCLAFRRSNQQLSCRGSLCLARPCPRLLPGLCEGHAWCVYRGESLRCGVCLCRRISLDPRQPASGSRDHPDLGGRTGGNHAKSRAATTHLQS